MDRGAICPMDLKLQHYKPTEDITVIAVDGEIDVGSGVQLRAYYLKLLDQGSHRFILDLRETTLMDSTGLAVILGLIKRTLARRKSVELPVALIINARRINWIIQSTGLDQVLPECPDIDTAITLMYTARFLLGRQRRAERLSKVDWFYSRIHVSNPGIADSIRSQLLALMDAFGIRLVYQIPSDTARSVCEIVVRISDNISSSSLAEQLTILYDVVRQHVHGSSGIKLGGPPDAAAAELITSLETVRKYIIQIGSVVLIKTNDGPSIRNLSDTELEQYESVPDLFRNPDAASTELQHLLQPETADSRRFILLLGSNWSGDAIANKVKATGLMIRRKAFYSQPRDWQRITPLLQDPRAIAIIAKLTRPNYRMIASAEYSSVTNQLFEALGTAQHVVFVQESIILPKKGKKFGSLEYSAPDVAGTEWVSPSSSPSAADIYAVAQLFRRHNINVVPFETQQELASLAVSFLEEIESNLLFRVYMPSGRLYASEAGKLISLFQEWLSSVGGRRIRQDGYKTAAGQVFEFFGDGSVQPGEIYSQFGIFAEFLADCKDRSISAASSLMKAGLGRTAAESMVMRYSKEVKRLELDVRQELEVKMLAIRHSLELELAELGGEFELPWPEIDRLVESIVPKVTSLLSIVPTVSSAREPLHPVTVNLNHQVINGIHGTVIQNVEGTVHLGPSVKDVIDIIRQYGDSRAAELETAIYELEDPDARPSVRLRARQKLKAFLFQLGDKVEQVGFAVLESYLQSKILKP
jgi:anti-anti-sigma factor